MNPVSPITRKDPLIKSVTTVKTVLAVLLLIGLSETTAHGQTSSAVQHVSVTVQPIVVMAVFGQPQPFVLDHRSNGGENSIRDLSSFYNLTTNVDGVILTAEIDSPMPAGTSLSLSAETTLGVSNGSVDISAETVGRHIVSSISRGLENNRRFAYEFRADGSVVSLPLQSRTVSLSLLNPATGTSTRFEQTIFFEVISSEVTQR